MPRLRTASSVSTDELIQLVTILKAEGEFPDVEPEVKVRDADGNCTEHSQAVNARRELNTALECLKQFSARDMYENLKSAISSMTNGRETPMQFILRKRAEMLSSEKGDAAKLQILAWMEGIVRAVATSHVKVQERLEIRKPAGALGNSVGNGSPYAMILRQREARKQEKVG